MKSNLRCYTHFWRSESAISGVQVQFNPVEYSTEQLLIYTHKIHVSLLKPRQEGHVGYANHHDSGD